jgi:curved DNA-binding protein CbpA
MTDADTERIFEWDATLDDASYYEILSVLEIADEQAIRVAFREFALAFHPDMHGDAPEDALVAVRRIFQRGAEAYRVLCDPELRVRYDMALAKGLLRLEQSEVKHARIETGVRSLDELCRSAAAKLCAQKADRLISEGDLAGAMRELKLALAHDGDANPALAERIEDLDVALYAMGS